ncbi:cardiolipin synthase [Neobacillus sp. LXY-1]|uniref:cardiolipin synthase n=1 Tax=Neobacillus sp. LXY-1 TaxID=3379133 RepID=UPI003EDF6318
MRIALLVAGLLLFFIIWLVLDFRMGQKKHLQEARPFLTPELYGHFEIFTHGQELFQRYFTDLRQARHHIHVLFYILKDDDISQEFFSILKKKASEGVEVRLLLDRLGSIKVKKAMVNDLKKAGVNFAFSNRVRLPFLFYSSQVRNHRKISIIDGEIGYLGGFNVGKEYIDEEPKLCPWRDYHLRISGESVNYLQKVFFMDWQEYFGEHLRHDSIYFPVLPKGDVCHQFIPTEAGQMEEYYVSLIRKAKKSIVIGTPYFIPSQTVCAELIQSRQRGVDITVIVPFKTDHPLVQEASFPYLRKLLEEDVAVYQYKHGFYHAKTVVIDDTICDIGTANFDRRSIFLNKEINCIFNDSAFIKRFKDIIQKDISDSESLTLATLTKPNLYRSIKEMIAGAISRFL